MLKPTTSIGPLSNGARASLAAAEDADVPPGLLLQPPHEGHGVFAHHLDDARLVGQGR